MPEPKPIPPMTEHHVHIDPPKWNTTVDVDEDLKFEAEGERLIREVMGIREERPMYGVVIYGATMEMDPLDPPPPTPAPTGLPFILAGAVVALLWLLYALLS